VPGGPPVPLPLVTSGRCQPCAQLLPIDDIHARLIVPIASAQDWRQQQAKVGIHAMGFLVPDGGGLPSRLTQPDQCQHPCDLGVVARACVVPWGGVLLLAR
jgi:hypothetical protein